MASTEAKAKRRAEGLNSLNRLSELLAEHLGIEVPDVRTTHRDPEFAQIMQIEAINSLLEKVLVANGIEVQPVDESSELKLESMTKAELLKLAEDRDVVVPKSAKKSEIIEALNA